MRKHVLDFYKTLSDKFAIPMPGNHTSFYSAHAHLISPDQTKFPARFNFGISAVANTAFNARILHPLPLFYERLPPDRSFVTFENFASEPVAKKFLDDFASGLEEGVRTFEQQFNSDPNLKNASLKYGVLTRKDSKYYFTLSLVPYLVGS